MYLVHPNFKDVFIEVLRHNEGRTLIRWWNIGFTGHPWQVPVKQSKFHTQELQWVDTARLLGMCAFDPSNPETHPGRNV
jgi:hypothetical protein